MSGGVSLAVWMGGIAHSLLRCTQKPEDYWCPTKPSLDVIAGTSAGGLNGVFLAAALAWDIPHEQFLGDVRNAWLRLGSLERLLRSPFDADPLSLFDGEEKYRKEVESVLLGWWASSQARPADNEDFRIHLVVPTTLLRPNIETYYDDLGTNFVEPTNALLSGEAAATAMAHWLVGRTGPAKEYERWLDRRFNDEWAERARQYSLETRFQEEPFWRRRHEVPSPVRPH